MMLSNLHLTHEGPLSYDTALRGANAASVILRAGDNGLHHHAGHRRPRAHAGYAARDVARSGCGMARRDGRARHLEPVRHPQPPRPRRAHELDPARAVDSVSRCEPPPSTVQSLRAHPRESGTIALAPRRRLPATARG